MHQGDSYATNCGYVNIIFADRMIDIIMLKARVTGSGSALISLHRDFDVAGGRWLNP